MHHALDFEIGVEKPADDVKVREEMGCDAGRREGGATLREGEIEDNLVRKVGVEAAVAAQVGKEFFGRLRPLPTRPASLVSLSLKSRQDKYRLPS
jgi:hypothetical protein